MTKPISRKMLKKVINLKEKIREETKTVLIYVTLRHLRKIM